MEKNYVYALLSAIALTVAVGLGSCSSKEDVADVNPNYDPETNSVLTQFVFNVSTSNQASTRQSADATQNHSTLAAAKFRGIGDAHIMCFRNPGDGRYQATDATAEKDFDMARVLAAGTISSDNSRRVLEMSLPLNTNTMVFYGRALKASGADKNEYGHLENPAVGEAEPTDGYNISSNLSKVSFRLGKRLRNADKNKFQQTQKLLAGILTCVMNTDRGSATVTASQSPEADVPAYGFDIPATALTWSQYRLGTDAKSPVDNTTPITELEVKLAKVYQEMTTIQTAELRNASGPALISTIQNLWSIVNSVRCATPTSQPEAVAKYMAHLISEELKKYFTYSKLAKDGSSVEGVGFAGGTAGTVENLVTSFEADGYWPTTAGTKPASTEFSAITAMTVSDLATFPENMDLPQGSTHITFDSDKKAFAYAENYNQSAVGGPSSAFTVDDYYYPAELLYFGNSPIRVSDVEHVVNSYPQNTTAWNSDEIGEGKAWAGWTNNSHVQSTTRSVAMRNDINYGTALLKTTIGYVNSSTTLKDNNAFIQKREYKVTEPNKKITPTATSFILKGIIIGGQSPRVGWNFLPALATGEKQGYVFDKAIAGAGSVPLSGNSEANYTLVFDNYNSTKTAGNQDKVYVALELQNNTGEDFFGKDNLIPKGANFYLIGELDPSAVSTTQSLVWSDYHALPPYNANGTSFTRTPRVFIQDYMTTANFKIGEFSLQYAYLTVPDLRSSSVTLGLSVDVAWSTGYEFEDVVVGGNKDKTPTSEP